MDEVSGTYLTIYRCKTITELSPNVLQLNPTLHYFNKCIEGKANMLSNPINVDAKKGGESINDEKAHIEKPHPYNQFLDDFQFCYPFGKCTIK